MGGQMEADYNHLLTAQINIKQDRGHFKVF